MVPQRSVAPILDITCSFSAADVGKQVMVTNGSAIGGVGPMVSNVYALASPTTLATITAIISATSVTVSSAGTATSAACAGSCVVAWGHNDGARLATAFAGLVASARGTCGTMELPNAMMFVNQAEFINGPASCFTAVGLTREGILIKGVGISSTWLIPTNDFNFTTCTGPDGLHSACFFANGTTGSFAGGTIVQDLTITGLGQSMSGVTHAVTAIDIESNSEIYNVFCTAWGGASPSMIGFQTGLGGSAIYDILYNIESDGCGSTGGKFTGNTFISGGSYIGDNSVIDMIVASGAITSNGNGYGAIQTSGTSAVIEVLSGTLTSTGDQIGYGGCNQAGSALVYVTGGGIASLDNDILQGGCTNAIWADNTAGNGKVYVANSSITGSTNAIKTTATATKVFLGEGNRYSGAASSGGAGSIVTTGLGESGTITCSTSAATITFLNVYGVAPNYTLFDKTTTGLVTTTSENTTSLVLGCPGASDVINYVITGNPF